MGLEDDSLDPTLPGTLEREHELAVAAALQPVLRYRWASQVADLRWNDFIKRLGTRAFSDAERDAKKPPYALLFGTLAPSHCRRLGAVKAGDLSDVLASKLRELGADYAPFEAELTQAAAALRAADQQRKLLQAADFART